MKQNGSRQFETGPRLGNEIHAVASLPTHRGGFSTVPEPRAQSERHGVVRCCPFGRSVLRFIYYLLPDQQVGANRVDVPRQRTEDRFPHRFEDFHHGLSEIV